MHHGRLFVRASGGNGAESSFEGVIRRPLHRVLALRDDESRNGGYLGTRFGSPRRLFLLKRWGRL